MKITALCLICVALPFGAFALWGMLTKSGQHRFDEMDGLYPMAAGFVAIVSALAGGLFWYFGGRTS